MPVHVNIFYCFGGLVITCFTLQASTGFTLSITYRPTVVEAFTSVQSIHLAINLGWFIRSLHRWSAGVLVLMLLLHMFRVYLTAGFKKPRELIWISGFAMALVTVSFGITGYTLPWDQVAYWACKIVTATPQALDDLAFTSQTHFGSILVSTIRGSTSVGQLTLTRFYAVHTFVLPSIGLSLSLVHFSIIRKQGISGPL